MFPLRDSTHLNPPSQGREKKTAQQIARLRNKCAITDYSHAELISVSCGLNPSPAFQAPSAQGRQGHTHRTALRFPLSPQVAREKIRSIGNMKENIFSNMVNSLFTTHHSLIHTDMVFSHFTSLFSLKAPAFDTDFAFINLKH
ncbi:hypothetical protein BHV42_08105 [Candidatus Melainabacteria bacterium MEL.A1]|nr:hypothetical protein BHV42_08105 [Candidatus Melainabacteria bacterium MEL.A1]